MSTLTMPVSAPRSSAEAMDPVDRARACMAAGRFSAARQTLEAALDVSPSDHLSRKLLAECLFRSGHPLASAEHWSRLISEDPTDEDGQHWINRLDPLVKAVEAVRRHNPRHIQVSIRKGVTEVSLSGLVASRSDGRTWTVPYNRVTEAIEQTASLGLPHCIVDMTNVTFVSSYFHGLVTTWGRRVKPAGGRIVLAGTRAGIHQALLQAGFRRSVRFAESVTAARSWFHSRTDRGFPRHSASRVARFAKPARP